MYLISIISPVCNEEKNIEYFYHSLIEQINPLKDKYNFEIIFTDNNSSDGTQSKIIELINIDNRVRYVKLSRNFGYQRSIWTGYSESKGDAVIELDVDLEDDPSHIHTMLKEWEDGASIVFGIRKKRDEAMLTQWTRKLYYRLLTSISEDDLPVDAGDFMLLDRRVVNIIKQSKDPNIYIRGLVFSLGFKRVGFPYERNKRLYGSSKFNIAKMTSLAMDGVIRHSVLPIRLSSWIAALLGGALILLAIGYSIFKQFGNTNWPPGFTTIVVLQLILFAILSLFIGIMGEYILRIYRIIKHEPMSLIEYELNSSLIEQDNRPLVKVVR